MQAGKSNGGGSGPVLGALGHRSEAEELKQASEAALQEDPRPVFRRPASLRLAGLAAVSQDR
jgi:hypothetical protein